MCAALLVKHGAFGTIMVVIGSLTLDRESLGTEKAAPASYGKRNDDSITTSEIAYVRAHVLDDAHEFMSHHQWLGSRKKSIVKVQV